MKISLKSKFLFCYIAIIAATLGILNTYGLKMLNNRIIKDEQVTLYNQAELLANQYLTNGYFSSSSIPIINKQFNLLTNMIGVNIMAVNTYPQTVSLSSSSTNLPLTAPRSFPVPCPWEI